MDNRFLTPLLLVFLCLSFANLKDLLQKPMLPIRSSTEIFCPWLRGSCGQPGGGKHGDFWEKWEEFQKYPGSAALGTTFQLRKKSGLATARALLLETWWNRARQKILRSQTRIVFLPASVGRGASRDKCRE